MSLINTLSNSSRLAYKAFQRSESIKYLQDPLSQVVRKIQIEAQKTFDPKCATYAKETSYFNDPSTGIMNAVRTMDGKHRGAIEKTAVIGNNHFIHAFRIDRDTARGIVQNKGFIGKSSEEIAKERGVDSASFQASGRLYIAPPLEAFRASMFGTMNPKVAKVTLTDDLKIVRRDEGYAKIDLSMAFAIFNLEDSEYLEASMSFDDVFGWNYFEFKEGAQIPISKLVMPSDGVALHTNLRYAIPELQHEFPDDSELQSLHDDWISSQDIFTDVLENGKRVFNSQLAGFSNRVYDWLDLDKNLEKREFLLSEGMAITRSQAQEAAQNLSILAGQQPA
jgi:hypothetical protein